MPSRKKTTIVRIRKRTSHYGTLDKRFLADVRMSWAAKGILAYLLLKPDDWKLQLGDLSRQSTDRDASVRARLNELLACGYIRRSCVKDRRSGRILRWEHIVFETPELARDAVAQDTPTLFEIFEPTGSTTVKPRFQRTPPDGGFPHVAEPHVGEPHVVNHPLPINDETDNRNTNDDEETGLSISSPDPASPGLVCSPSSFQAAPESFVVVESHDTDAQDALLLLVSCGFEPQDARSILSRTQAAGNDASAGRVRQVLAHARTRKPSHQRGFVVKALERAWQLGPVDAKPVDRQAEAARADRDRQRREVEAGERADGLSAMNAAVDALSLDEWNREVAEVWPRLSPAARARLNGTDTRLNPMLRVSVFQNLKTRCVQ